MKRRKSIKKVELVYYEPEEEEKIPKKTRPKSQRKTRKKTDDLETTTYDIVRNSQSPLASTQNRQDGISIRNQSQMEKSYSSKGKDLNQFKDEQISKIMPKGPRNDANKHPKSETKIR